MSVPERRQYAVIEELPSPWLTRPAPTHMTLAWQFLKGQLRNRCILYTTLHADEEMARWQKSITRIVVKVSWKPSKI